MPVVRKRVPMKNQPPDERIKNFKEVPLGYNKKEAIKEAERCLQCKHSPCVSGCPVNVPIPRFIKALRENDIKGANRIIKSKNNLPAICGRVCPQENQCEKVCVLGQKFEPVAIGRLERFVADLILEQEKNNNSGEKTVTDGDNISTNSDSRDRVAVVGSGPAGLTAAADLAKEGFKVTVFEALHDTGGVLRYGIPEFRLPKSILDQEVENIKKLGVEFKLNVIIGKTITIDELFEDGYKAVFIGTGAGLPLFLNIPGENLNGVYSANEFLTRVNLMKAYKFPEFKTPVKVGRRVAVIGGGNVAMDAARTAKRLGAEKVMVVYRRSEEEMPARNEEIEHAREEGIEFILLSSPVKIHGENGLVTALECIKMELGEKDKSGRRRPIPVEGSNWNMKLDTVIVAIGQTPNPLLTSNSRGIETESWGGIKVDENLSTSRQGVFAGGDVVTGAATVIEAMGAGKKAARSILEYLRSDNKDK
ncbi:NADPH-dependent glutamate synthase [Halothermothrix orenii]|uniref:Glutamate synthase (NADPH) small subunit n=1 Tax=Halothermothrix orenii (strain H 168 / OCM 544 / DSM 9562) TaxID=373903 RepID=B8D2H7_HALOH|nr:NADPH-dependent glutamate synthase [Halothermothrix orenii]ACL69404.1 glutamate synthase (NADPH) small subunit [Halothermothrix orenii H 168]